MSCEPVKPPETPFAWSTELNSIPANDLDFRIGTIILSLFVVCAGCIATYFLLPHLGNWSFVVLGSSFGLAAVLSCLAMCKNRALEHSEKQQLLTEYREATKYFAKNDDLQGLNDALDMIEGYSVTPAFFLKQFLTRTEEGFSDDWRKCGVAILSGNLELLRTFLAQNPGKDFWETAYQGYTALDLAALMVNHTGSQTHHELTMDLGDHNQKEILVLLHQSYATYLDTLLPGKKAQQQAEALFRSAEICLTPFANEDFLLEGTQDLNLQSSFAQITKTYAPTCPHTHYVTQESLDKVDPFYNANQRMFAEWCHITALAFRTTLHTYSMDTLTNMGARSRFWLAQVCRSENAQDYGQYRILSNGEVSKLYTPINDPQFPRYKPWYEMTYEPWMRNGKNYVIQAVDTDGSLIEGTSFTEISLKRNGIPSSAYFSWKHGKSQNELHKMSERWLIKVLNSQNDPEEFFSNLGCYYHTLCQYTPFKRGSATFANCILASLLTNYQDQHPSFILPQATNLFDCHALSMQQKSFVEQVFVPWCKGTLGKKTSNT